MCRGEGWGCEGIALYRSAGSLGFKERRLVRKRALSCVGIVAPVGTGRQGRVRDWGGGVSGWGWYVGVRGLVVARCVLMVLRWDPDKRSEGDDRRPTSCRGSVRPYARTPVRPYALAGLLDLPQYGPGHAGRHRRRLTGRRQLRLAHLGSRAVPEADQRHVLRQAVARVKSPSAGAARAVLPPAQTARGPRAEVVPPGARAASEGQPFDATAASRSTPAANSSGSKDWNGRRRKTLPSGGAASVG